MWAMTIEWVHLYKYMYFFSDSYTITTVSIIYTYITVLYYLLILYYSWFAATNSRLILVRSKFWKIMLGGFPIFDTKIWDDDISGWNSHGVDWHGRAKWCPFLFGILQLPFQEGPCDSVLFNPAGSMFGAYCRLSMVLHSCKYWCPERTK